MNAAPRSSGFTLVELVMVIILIGVLSALGVGLFAGRSTFSPLVATQQLSSATLLAQQAALAGNGSNSLTIVQTPNDLIFSAASSEFTLSRNGVTLAYGVAANPYTDVPAGGLTLVFDDFGRVTSSFAGNNIDFRLSGDSNFDVCLSSLGAVFEGSCP